MISQSTNKPLILLSVLLLSLACTLPSQVKPTPQPVLPTPTPISLQTQPTPLPQEGDCSNRIGAIRDVTIPDDDPMAPGETFTKTWELENAGTCTWTQNYLLKWTAEEELGGISPLPLGAMVRPGEKAEVSMQFTAPPAPGKHRSLWMIQDGFAKLFGSGEAADQPFWVQIVTQPAETAQDYAALQITNADYSGVCPLSLILRGSVLQTRPGDGEISVEMGSDDPNVQLSPPDPQTHAFSAGEVFQVEYPILLTQSMQGWARLTVRGAGQLNSEKVAFNIRCK
jgi:hypothetical protein